MRGPFMTTSSHTRRMNLLPNDALRRLQFHTCTQTTPIQRTERNTHSILRPCADQHLGPQDSEKSSSFKKVPEGSCISIIHPYVASENDLLI